MRTVSPLALLVTAALTSTLLASTALAATALTATALTSAADAQRVERPGVTLYDRPNFKGIEEKFTEDDSNFADNRMGHDRVGSVRVAAGCRVTLYRKSGFQGPFTTLEGDAEDLGATAVGRDKASSLRLACGDYLADERPDLGRLALRPYVGDR